MRSDYGAAVDVGGRGVGMGVGVGGAVAVGTGVGVARAVTVTWICGGSILIIWTGLPVGSCTSIVMGFVPGPVKLARLASARMFVPLI